MKNFKTPVLMADDHHGQYMMQLLFNDLAPRYKKQAEKALSKEDIQAIKEGPENEFHFEACDNLTNVTFKTPTGGKFNLQYCEGGIFAIPFCFLRTKEANEFFGN